MGSELTTGVFLVFISALHRLELWLIALGRGLDHCTVLSLLQVDTLALRQCSMRTRARSWWLVMGRILLSQLATLLSELRRSAATLLP